jgi:hypothetical protein
LLDAATQGTIHAGNVVNIAGFMHDSPPLVDVSPTLENNWITLEARGKLDSHWSTHPMQQHIIARLAFPTFDPSHGGHEIPSIIMGFFAFIFALTLVGSVLYLYISDVFRISTLSALRPLRFAVYAILLFCAMTFFIFKIDQYSLVW